MLEYITSALERMNILKEEFRPYRRTQDDDKYFNFPKWYALTYITQDVCMYGALDGICTGLNSEAYYSTRVKQFYTLTNKKDFLS
jgi:hypothetical protein